MLILSPGKYLRFGALFNSARHPLIVCPIDDLLIFGPKNGLEHPFSKIKKILDGKPDAMLTFPGTLARFSDLFEGTKVILNLTGSTHRSKHTKKVRLHDMEVALRLSASAVAVHINLCSRYASDMIEVAARVVSEAQRYDMPTLGIIYPRGERGKADDNQDDVKRSNLHEYGAMVAQCVSLGVDLGFDVIKTFYTDDDETFRDVIAASRGVPVLVAGGAHVADDVAISRAKSAILAGASGVCFGRNVFGRSEPGNFLNKLREEIGN